LNVTNPCVAISQGRYFAGNILRAIFCGRYLGGDILRADILQIDGKPNAACCSAACLKKALQQKGYAKNSFATNLQPIEGAQSIGSCKL
jgi:hypothetical protein